ncbi:MAG: class I SAM-dependent methyltransferase [Oscillospiraceae bacterium]|nr:class I SAM-dependent methyltransferase [Oscillospiraceae bacterium]
MLENVIQFYENYDEDGRLFRDKAHMIEYLTTIHYFDRMFTSDLQILDACAGTGRYSFYLADKGHIVTACDLVEYNADIIKSKPDADKLSGISVCNVLDMSQFEQNSFDVVLCMGALYHLDSIGLKEKAVSECTRVCKMGGIVVLAYIVDNPKRRLKNPGHCIYDGIFFSSGPRKIEKIAAKCGLEKMRNIGTDGLIYNTGIELNEASDADFEKYMDHYYLICEDESSIEASIHGLYIGKKIKNSKK